MSVAALNNKGVVIRMEGFGYWRYDTKGILLHMNGRWRYGSDLKHVSKGLAHYEHELQ
jgi:hypothetical protein